jgi:uncharacterized protein (DUF2225 family)
MISKVNLTDPEPLYDKKFECLICRHSYKSKKIRSRYVKPERVDSDFGPIFKHGDGNNPLLYYVTVCPQCGFSFTEDFSKNIGQKVRKKIQEEISGKIDKSVDYCGVRNLEIAVNAYKLAIFFAQLLEERHIVFANLCLRLAWLKRGVANKEEERRFLQLAASEFEQSFIKSDFNPETTPEIQILYLIGELNRKLGKYNESVKFFTTVVEHPDRSRYRKYVNMAREQWKLAAEEYRAQKGRF